MPMIQMMIGKALNLLLMAVATPLVRLVHGQTDNLYDWKDPE